MELLPSCGRSLQPLFVPNAALALLLKKLKDEGGWEPVRELPPYRTTGTYTIQIRKPE